MTPVFREAKAADDRAIGELLIRAFVEAYAERMPEVVVGDARKADLRDVAKRRKTAKVVVMEVDGFIVGTYTLTVLGDSFTKAWLPDSTELKQLATSRDFHGRGYGDLLVENATEVAKEMLAQAICLHVRRGANGVAKMYEKAGYQRCAEEDLNLPEIYLEAYFLALAH